MAVKKLVPLPPIWSSQNKGYAKAHPEPDADQAGGKPDGDADDMQPKPAPVKKLTPKQVSTAPMFGKK